MTNNPHSNKNESSTQYSLESFMEKAGLLNHIVNLLPVRIFWKDTNLCYLGCNTAFANDAGMIAPEDLIGKDDYAMGWKDQADIYRNDDMDVINSKQPKINIEEPQTTPSGETIWLLTNKVPLTNKENNVIGVLGTYHDITEQKLATLKMNEALKDLQEFQSVAIDREHKMIELKKEINELSKELGRKEPY